MARRTVPAPEHDSGSGGRGRWSASSLPGASPRTVALNGAGSGAQDKGRMGAQRDNAIGPRPERRTARENAEARSATGDPWRAVPQVRRGDLGALAMACETRRHGAASLCPSRSCSVLLDAGDAAERQPCPHAGRLRVARLVGLVRGAADAGELRLRRCRLDSARRSPPLRSASTQHDEHDHDCGSLHGFSLRRESYRYPAASGENTA